MAGRILNPKEKAYSFRYEYDFKDYVPGLRFMTRYTMGRNIYAPNLGGTDLKERETDFDIGYTVQTGWLKTFPFVLAMRSMTTTCWPQPISNQ